MFNTRIIGEAVIGICNFQMGNAVRVDNGTHRTRHHIVVTTQALVRELTRTSLLGPYGRCNSSESERFRHEIQKTFCLISPASIFVTIFHVHVTNLSGTAPAAREGSAGVESESSVGAALEADWQVAMRRIEV